MNLSHHDSTQVSLLVLAVSAFVVSSSVPSLAQPGPLGPICPENVCGTWLPLCLADDTEIIHAALLHTGELLVYGRHHNGGLWDQHYYVWSPTGGCGTLTPLPDAPHGSGLDHLTCQSELNLVDYTPFCAGHDFDEDGRLLIVGGNDLEDSPGGDVVHKTNHTMWFDVTDAPTYWTPGPNLNRTRWYSWVRVHPFNNTFYSWTGSSATYCPNSPQSSQTIEILEGFSDQEWEFVDSAGGPCHPPLELYSPTFTLPASWPVSSQAGKWWSLSHPPASATQISDTWVLDPTPSNCSFSPIAVASHRPQHRPDRQHRDGAEVLAPYEFDGAQREYKPGPNIYVFGGFEVDPLDSNCSLCGSTDPHNEAEYFSAATQSWQTTEIAEMNYPRQDADAVLLPDETILVVGGGREATAPSCVNGGAPTCGNDETQTSAGTTLGIDCAQHNPEIYDPRTNTWTIVDAHLRPRLYHSVAVLLPNGSVFVGGGEWFTQAPVSCNELLTGTKFFEENYEIYQPPYFFQLAARPQVTQVLSTTAYFGCDFTFQVSNWDADPTNNRVLLMRQATNTHSSSMSQSHAFVPFEQRHVVGDTYRVTITLPERAEQILQAGWYMLWATTDWNEANRLPCVEAPFVQVMDGTCLSLGAMGGVVVAGGEAQLELTVRQRPAGAAVDFGIAVPANMRGASLAIYDIAGRFLTMVTDNLEPGPHSLEWHPNTGFASGVYVARLSSGRASQVEKVLVLQ